MSRQVDTSQPITPEEAEYLRQRDRLPEDVQIEGGDADSPATEYETMTKRELRRELKRRDRDYSDASKEELVSRLLEADEEEPPRMTAPSPEHYEESEEDDDSEE